MEQESEGKAEITSFGNLLQEVAGPGGAGGSAQVNRDRPCCKTFV